MAETSPGNTARTLIRFGVFEADIRSSELRKNGRRVRLDGQPFRILVLLLEHPGELVTREEVQRALWPSGTFVDFDHSINAAVKRLRNALGESAETPRFIETLPRRGYRFIAPIGVVDPAASPPRRATTGRAILAPLVLVGVVAISLPSIGHGRSVNALAYEKFLAARALLWEGTDAARGLASKLLLEATAIDPDLHEAYAYLALLSAHGGAYLAGPGRSGRAVTRQWADKALAADGGSAEAHAALGWMDLTDLDWRGADEHFQRAIRANPGLPVARSWYSQCLSARGQFDQAILEAQRAIELAPRDASVVTHAAIAYFEAQRIAEAVKIWKGVITWSPNYWAAHHFLARAALVQDKPNEALEELRLAVELRNPSQPEAVDLAVMAGALAKAGRTAEAQAIVDDLERRRAAEQKVARNWLALAHLGVGNTERSVYWLEKAYENGSSGIFSLDSDPLFAPLRDVPRFRGLMTCIFSPVESRASAGACPGDTPQRPSSVR